jgi:hypothetical protein
MFLRQSGGLAPVSRTLLALGFAVNYVSHPTSAHAFYQRVNLETTFIALATAFAAWLWYRRAQGRPIASAPLFGAGLVFGYVAPMETAFLVAAYLLLELLTFDAERGMNGRPVGAFLAGVVLAAVIFAVQLAAAQARYPSLVLSGSALKARMGLDGSTRWYHNFHDIVRGGIDGVGKRLSNSLWKEELLLGACGFVVLLPKAVRAIRLRDFSLGAYGAVFLILYAFHAAFFTQMVVIHPYFFDAFAVTGFYVFGFLLLPERLCGWSTGAERALGYGREDIEKAIVLVFGIASLFLLGNNLRKLALSFPS